MTARISTPIIGNAQAGDVRSTKTFSGVNVTPGKQGTLVTQSAPATITPGTANQNFAAGIYDAAFSVQGDPNLVAGNIASGVSIFGVAGTSVTAAGNAVPADVASGKTFTSGTAGGTQTGTMAVHYAATGSATSSSTTLAITLDTGGTLNKATLSVTGLSFTPTTVVLVRPNAATSAYDVVTAETNVAMDTGSSNAKIMQAYASANSTVFVLDGTTCYINNTGFRLPVQNASTSYDWYAYA